MRHALITTVAVLVALGAATLPSYGDAGPWTMSSPRDGTLYFVQNAPQIYTNYNMLASNWSEHAASNTNNSFLQLADDGNASLTSAIAGWDASNTVFSMTVTGANAPYPYSRFWQPDKGMAWGVKFLNYTYSFTATFDTPAIGDGNDFLVSSGTATSIVGSFTGTFQSTDDVNKNPITNGDVYGFNVDFSKALFTANQVQTPIGDPYGYGGTTGIPFTQFGSRGDGACFGVTNELGYQGTVWNITQASALPADVSVPLPAAAWGGIVLLGSVVGAKGLKRLRRQEA